ncbi:hypothetical protein FB451DRAFT_1385486 [Mycena latifolia]|nr:hypothetical protein FB451DRAFT_1385486 [Mycena latifolia]
MSPASSQARACCVLLFPRRGLFPYTTRPRLDARLRAADLYVPVEGDSCWALHLFTVCIRIEPCACISDTPASPAPFSSAPHSGRVLSIASQRKGKLDAHNLHRPPPVPRTSPGSSVMRAASEAHSNERATAATAPFRRGAWKARARRPRVLHYPPSRLHDLFTAVRIPDISRLHVVQPRPAPAHISVSFGLQGRLDAHEPAPRTLAADVHSRNRITVPRRFGAEHGRN